MKQQQVREWFLAWGKACIAEKEYLSDLDTAIGDGDHGFNMAKAFEVYQETIGAKNVTDLADEFKQLGMILLSKVGGTAGPIYASGFLQMAKTLADKDELDDTLLAEAVSAGVEAIQKRGKAEVGEKTLVDVWVPIAKMLAEGTLKESVIDELVNHTKELKATKGRASYLGERSIGHIDPGSYSSGLLFKTYLANR